MHSFPGRGVECYLGTSIKELIFQSEVEGQGLAGMSWKGRKNASRKGFGCFKTSGLKKVTKHHNYKAKVLTEKREVPQGSHETG